MAAAREDLAAMGKQLTFRLILASSSPARRDLLQRAGYDFEIVPSDVDDPTNAGFADPALVSTSPGSRQGRRSAGLAFPRSRWSLVWLPTVGWLNGRPIDGR